MIYYTTHEAGSWQRLNVRVRRSKAIRELRKNRFKGDRDGMCVLNNRVVGTMRRGEWYAMFRDKLIHSVLFSDGRSWDALNGYRPNRSVYRRVYRGLREFDKINE
jgi:hypothetical protein